MRKFTSMIALLLTCTGAFAQVTAPTTKLSATELTDIQTSKRVFLKATSRTNGNWFTGEVSSQNLSEKTLFELVKKDNGHVLKRVATNNFIKNNNGAVGFGNETEAQKFEFIANPTLTDTDLIGEGEYVRFKQLGGNNWLNVKGPRENPVFNNGTGSWTVVRVFDASDYSFVTLNITKDGQSSTVKQVYKTGDNIVPPTYIGYDAVYTETTKENNDEQTLNVSYVSVLEEAKSVQETQGKVGYPSNAQLYETLGQNITTAESSATEANFTALRNSINALYNATEVNLPVDGKTYVFTNHHKKNDGTIAQNYFKCTADGLTLVGRGNAQAAAYPYEAKFTCHKVAEGKFMFVNNLGYYLVFKGNSNQIGTNDNKGYVDAYDATYCPMTVQKDAAGCGKELFGLVSFGGKRADKDKESYFTVNFNKPQNLFEQADGLTFYFDTNHSTAFQIEEVSYPNNPTLNTIMGNAVSITGAKSIATFSAPFATTIPTGVSAFYARQIDTNTAQLEKFTGNVIPANTGVILTSEETERTALMVPATEAATDVIQNNQLGHSAGEDKPFTTESFYILGKSKNNIVGFFKGKANTTLPMNKSYLKSNSAAAAMKLIYGGENPGDGTTGIESLDAQDNASAAPIYDLSGRRVMKTVKGGLYIQNGKKLIIK